MQATTMKAMAKVAEKIPRRKAMTKVAEKIPRQKAMAKVAEKEKVSSSINDLEVIVRNHQSVGVINETKTEKSREAQVSRAREARARARGP